MRKSLIILTAMILLLAACAPAAAVQSPQDVRAQVETSVAMTVSAQDQVAESIALTMAAQQALASPTPDATSTPDVPPTLPVIPTITALTIPTSGGGGSTYVKPDYACDIIHARPYDDSEFHAGDKFDIKWTILNTGAKTWPAGYDVKYDSGPHMTTLTRVQIPVEMKPGAQYDFVFDAVAPAEKGTQIMVWMVQGQMCYPYVRIIVK
jgi:hypothetical protein